MGTNEKTVKSLTEKEYGDFLSGLAKEIVCPICSGLHPPGHKDKELEAKCNELRTQLSKESDAHLRALTYLNRKLDSAEFEVTQLKNMLDSLTADEQDTIKWWKKLFDAYVDLKAKNDKMESALHKIQTILKEQCPDIEKCQDIPSDPSCDGCDRYVLWEALGGSESTQKAHANEVR